ncbi:hypothetical protein FVE67_05020 [Thermosulfurimonas marina]|uniref:Uncharacterized protein n=1 Tax=Thermosulfurimonas marina TaxID=2047767 RepID=A0A6H1WSQ1_9BACT|nr:hypothetical protein [Thermosulfurimonas marina]QJA06200.1 hypothetical protein FVE67_05020 [Thermosulfurimonas marina]
MRKNPLWNLVFLVILILALLLARYYRTEHRRSLLSRYPLFSPAGKAVGELSFWTEDSRDRILKIELSRRPPEPLLVVLYYAEGVGRSLGRMEGVVFVHSLGPAFLPEKVVALKLRGVRSERIYAEFRRKSREGLPEKTPEKP